MILRTIGFIGSFIAFSYAGPVLINPNNFLVVSASQQAVADLAKSYEFGYQSVDEVGTSQHRQEASDGKGVQGSYGYMDPLGVYRTVKYVADDDGFRAVVSSNEPGMGTSSSANAVYVIQPPPPAALLWQDLNRYTPIKNREHKKD